MKLSPKKIKNELTSCCAMKVHNTLALDEPKRMKDQHEGMVIFFMDINLNILVKSNHCVLLHVHVRDCLTRLLPSLQRRKTIYRQHLLARWKLNWHEITTGHATVRRILMHLIWRRNSGRILNWLLGGNCMMLQSEEQSPMKRCYLLQLTSGIWRQIL